MLILRIVALDPVHGYRIAARLRRISNDVLHVNWKESDTGPDAKYYSFAKTGAKPLVKRELAEFE